MGQVTLDEALETAMRLDPAQREMLVEILRRRQVETERAVIARQAQAAIGAFRAGGSEARDAEDIIQELRRSLVAD